MNNSFGNKIKRLRLAREWSQQDLSIHSGISTPHISSLERGKRFPSFVYANRLANAFGVSVDVLGDESKNLEIPRMRGSSDELPIHLKNFVLNEASTPYLTVAHRLSTLPKEDAEFFSMLVDMLTEKRGDTRPA